MNEPGIRIAVAAALLCAALRADAQAAAPGAPAAAAPAAASVRVGGTLDGAIVEVDRARSSVKVLLPDRSDPVTLAVPASADRDRLAGALPGDRVSFEVADVAAPGAIEKLRRVTRAVAGLPRLLALGLSALLLIGIGAAFTGGKPQRFVIGVDNRYSNSQMQMALWFGIVAAVYLATVALRLAVLGWDYLGGVGITENLLVLTGLSALSFGGAKVITVAKLDAASEKGVLPQKVEAARPRLLTDLVQNDKGQADIGDFQMILVAAAAFILFGLSSFHFLGALELATPVQLPDVDSTMLSAFGLGQGAYLIKKAAMKAGEG
jgi:hypothetical protein